MRGQSLIDKVTDPLITKEMSGEKGHRNADLELRNKLLATRFYFYAHYYRYQFDKIVLLLHREHFIKPRTVETVLYSVDDELKRLKALSPTPKDLQREYPWLNWSF